MEIKRMNSAITAIGTAVPIHKRDQKTAAEIVANALNLKGAEKRLLRSVYKSTGIEFRHSVMSDFCKNSGDYEVFPNDPNLPFPSTAVRMQVYKKYALELALVAIRNCLQQNPSFVKEKITHVITVSCTGMYAPGLDIEIIQALHLNSQVKRFCINFMGCYATFNALKVADAICQSQQDANVLLVSVELCTIHFQKNDSMDNIISNAIFSDGAGAILVQAEQRQRKSFSLQSFHCDLLPQNSKDMAWQIADSGFDIVLSSYVPQAVQSGIPQFMDRLLNLNNLQLSEIDLFAIHPGGYKILKACEAALKITEQDNQYSYQVLKNFGNMSSATVIFVLKAIWDELQKSDHQKKIFSCAFGPGLTLEGMILEINEE